MDFTLDDEQQALRDAVRGMLKDVDPTGQTEQRDLWPQFAEMGLAALAQPEDMGGSGATAVDVAVVAEEIGRAGARLPFLEASVLAGSLIAACGTDEQRKELIGGLADGSRVPVFAGLEPGSRWAFNAGGVTYADGALTGVKEPVVAGPRADVFIVSAVEGDGVGLFLVDAADAEVTTYDTFDGRKASRVVLQGTAASRLGDEGDRSAEITHAVAAAQIAACAEALGAMDTAMRMTTEYLKTRQQFGVPLNKFQALTFRAADLYTSLELTRSIVNWATMVLDAKGDSDPDAVTEAAARAKLQVSKAGRHIGQEAIQLHGGIGMTMEYAVGHFTARLTALDHLFGDGRAQTAKLVEHLTAHDTVNPLD